MSPVRYSLADLDGVLHVVFTTTDFSRPVIVANYSPTVALSRDVLMRYLDTNDVSRLSELSVVQSRPGEYFIGVRADYGGTWRQGEYISLLHGSSTVSAKSVVRDATAPKVRKGILVYWSSGCWVKHLKSGVQRIDPLSLEVS